MKRRLLLLALALVVAGPAAAAPTNGFERPGGGPRAAALGGHAITLLEDDDVMGANPGRLVFAHRSASAQYDQVEPDIDLWRGRAGVAWPLGHEITEPLQATHAYRGALGVLLDVTSLTLIEGSAYRESQVALGGAIAPASIFGLGASVSYERATSDADQIAAHAWGIDLGTTLDLSDHWTAAIAIKNAFGRAQYDGGQDADRAAETTFGVAARGYRRWQAEADYVTQHNTSAAVSGGVEIRVVPGVFDLRGGVARELLGGGRTVPSAGAGFLIGKIRLDYAFRSDTDGGTDAQHQVALGARF